MSKAGEAFVWIELVPLAIAVLAFIFLKNYRAQVVAITIASPVPPFP